MAIHINELSIKSLIIGMAFGETPLSTGTAFMVESAVGPVLVTNRHNVTGRHQETGQPISAHGGLPDQMIVWHNSATHITSWVPGRYQLFDGDKQPFWKEHPAFGPEADFVALPLQLPD